MNGLEEALDAAAGLPGIYGAILCDFEGEAVMVRFGEEPLPEGALDHATSQVPHAVRADAASGEYLLRLAGAEPCALVALFQQRSSAGGAGELEAFELGFRRVRVTVIRLPEEYYLAVFARSDGAPAGWVRRVCDRVRPILAGEVGG